MKTRTGFVSNSSSSSFIIAAKEFDEDMIRTKLNEILQLPKGHPLERLSDGVVEQIMSELDLAQNQFETVEEYLEENGDGSDELNSFDQRCVDLLKRGLKITTGSFEDSYGEGISLTEVGFDIDHDDFVIWSEEGY